MTLARPANPLRRIGPRIVAAFVLLSLSGCVTYSKRVETARFSLEEGDTETAIALFDKRLKVAQPDGLPKNLKRNRVLFLLERATLFQARGDYELAARDMMIADQRLEYLDISTNADAVADYVYSGSAKRYKAPPYERLMLNMLNMVNFMVLGDFEDAKVEARRFRLIEAFFLDGDEVVAPGLLAAGHYLAGTAFEASRDLDEAMAHFAKAWFYGKQDKAFRARLFDLARVTGFTAKEAAGPAFLGGSRLALPMTVPEYMDEHVNGELLVIVQTGMVPYKEPRAVHIATAADEFPHLVHHMGADDFARFNNLAVSGAMQTLRFPMLTDEHLPPPREPLLFVGEQPRPMRELVNVSEQVELAWNALAHTLFAAAFVRMIVRAAAGTAGRLAGRAMAEADNGAVAALGVVVWLVATIGEASAIAGDTPDTRSWTTLPGAIDVVRVDMPADTRLRLVVGDRTETRVVQPADGLRVVNFSRLR